MWLAGAVVGELAGRAVCDRGWQRGRAKGSWRGRPAAEGRRSGCVAEVGGQADGRGGGQPDEGADGREEANSGGEARGHCCGCSTVGGEPGRGWLTTGARAIAKPPDLVRLFLPTFTALWLHQPVYHGVARSGGGQELATDTVDGIWREERETPNLSNMEHTLFLDD